jgi:hypothetical protein
MRRLPLWILLLLSLALPVYGSAGFAVPQAPCAMADMDAAVMAADEAAGDCCNDLDTYAQTGQACKAGQECPASPTLTVSADPAGLLTLQAQAPPAGGVHQPPRGEPGGIWRPPAFL